MYDPVGGVAECDGCRRQMLVELRMIRNLEAEPQVLDEIREGIIFDFVCRYCHSTTRLPHPLLVYHQRHLPTMLYIAVPGMSRHDSQWTGTDLAQVVRAAENLTEAPHVGWGELEAITPVIENWMTEPTPANQEAAPPEEPLPDDLEALLARIRERLDPSAAVVDQLTQVDTSLAELSLARRRFGEAADQRIAEVTPVLEKLRIAVELTQIEELIDPVRGATPQGFERALIQSTALEERAEGSQRAHASVYRALARFKLDEHSGVEDHTEAIAILEPVLPVLRAEAERTWLAAALSNLGMMYYEQRRTGAVDTWIERSIRVGEEALGLPELSRVDSLRDRARRAAVLGNLHNAYGARLTGDPAENEARSFRLGEEALALLDPAESAFTVALIRNNLGMQYLRSQRGDRSANIEKAREELEFAATGLRREHAPMEWAMVQNNLGICYQERYAGDRAGNIEMAFTCFSNATAATRRENNLGEWSRARLGLAMTMLERDLEPVERFEQQSVDLIEEVLAAVEPDTPVAGECHQQLATLFGRRVNSGAVEYAGRALEHGARAILLHDRDRQPRAWGLTMSGLSLVKAQMADPDLPGSLKCAEDAIKALPRDSLPFEWGIAQLNKAVVHQIHGNLGAAVVHGELALQELTPARAPVIAARAADVVGECHAEAARWPEAAEAFQSAVTAFRYAYQDAARASARTALFRQAGVAHTSAAYATARAGDLAQAAMLAEAGRAFALREALELDPDTVDLSADHDSDEYREYLSALASMRAAEAAVRVPWLAHPRTTAQQARSEDRQRQSELESARRAAAQARARLTTPAPTDVAAIRRYAAGLDAVVYILSSAWGTVMLTLRPETGLIEKREHAFTHEHLAALLLHRDGPRGGLLVGAVLGGELMRQAIEDLQRSPVAGWLRDGLQGLGTTMIVPMGPWSAVPFALFTEDGSVLVHAVSAEVRHHCRTRLARKSGRRPGVLGYAHRSLPLASREVEAVAAMFGDGLTVPAGPSAKDDLLAALARFDHLHLATHGIYQLDEPAESAIYVDEEPLPLRELIQHQLLNGVRLAFLSACQTGISDVLSARDEVVGLPSACIHSGAIGVIGTLWQVDDAATLLLVQTFYREYRSSEPPVALARARKWLRTVSAGEILRECADLPPALEFLRLRPSTDRPFSEPYFWAPFIYVGA
ncbi:CHAT domain-containing protein [Amycolatopsis balhimycina DSM 5908]|uniref:CHAT domain-containing protein n=1 Tax=Amycolatopsis balhimycina DSM 5908 TaxID=1081091 RepID=A0A428WP27_AMYBA|nr:CHAT domain-containing protein [Amycolatopsis balhimycina]RSM44831.1 CHAT domain-containing protein [Amycolatopsis balhimycina DSM 5908]